MDVSILMPVFNAEATLEASVRSVTGQTHANWELIMVDDGSTDGTAALAERLAAGDRRLRFVRAPANEGAAAARNRALALAQGRYIAFLDADDRWKPQKLQRQLAFMRQKGAGLCYTGYHRVSPSGQLIKAVAVPESVSYAALLKRNILGCLTVVYDSQMCGKCPMPDLRRQQDYALWLSMVRRHGTAYGLNEPLAIYRVGTATLSSNKFMAATDMWRVYRQHERLPLLQAMVAFGHYVYFGLRDRLREKADADAPVV